LDARIAQRFERLLDSYRRSDGRKWGGKDLHNETGGVVTGPYVTHLRKCRIGFGSPTSFRDCFKRLVGTSPQAYRRTFQGSPAR
jgi:hypothetical protein